MAHLSRRHREVAYLVYKGLTNPEIATCLGIGPETVKTYMVHLFVLCDVKSRVELAILFHPIFTEGHKIQIE